MHGSFFLRNVISHRALMTAATTILVALAPLGGASAYTLKTLHSFCKWDNCADGYLPLSRLIMDPSGNLYGTATNGAHSGGVLFKLVPNGDGSWKEYVLHAFCAAPNCADGDDPEGDLIMDVDGNLYGTTAFGGKFGYGAIFRLTHNGGGWTLKILHSFCAAHNCSDGYQPLTGLSYVGQAPDVPWDKATPLFGTTNGSGLNGNGLAYELSPIGSHWQYQSIFRFVADHATPSSLVVDSPGTLFGLNTEGGKYGEGVFYKLVLDLNSGRYKEQNLHSFCSYADCGDGALPVGQLLLNRADEGYFGTTHAGGAHTNCPDNIGCGVFFEGLPGGGYAPFYDFCLLENCVDGSRPNGGLVANRNGELFGTTHDGGQNGAGAVFELRSQNGGEAWQEFVLYNFCSRQNCTDGKWPTAPLIMDTLGNLYGTTSEGTALQAGTVFELVP